MKLFFSHTTFDHVKAGFIKRKKLIFVSAGTTACIVFLIIGGSAGYMRLYEDRIFPRISVGGIDLGGMTHREAQETLQNRFNRMIDQQLALSLDGSLSYIDLRTQGSTDPDLVVDLIDFDADSSASAAFDIGHSGRLFDRILTAYNALLSPSVLTPQMTFIDARLEEAMHTAFKERETVATPTTFSISLKPKIAIEVEEGTEGFIIDTDQALKTLKTDAKDFSLQTIPVKLVQSQEVIPKGEAGNLIPSLTAFLEAAPYTLTYTSDALREFSWEVSAKDLQNAVIPVRNENGVVEIKLSSNGLEALFTLLEEDVNRRAQNARFVIEEGRVVEFAGSQNGVELNREETMTILESMLGSEEASSAIAVNVVPPTITTGSVNDLGIKEILGVGISNFAGSPSNRIANITHGASKLNGLLIPPGETASLLDELKPFTIADGYLPELVIKGDEIKPEVGGGLCQIGTTTFRAVMNSGLEVVERRNHSLVVSYYNDPSNGNPGTDATIYDPAPDFKFKNDTANHILLTTEVDLTRKELVFTFWGTDDGRKGSYTPPVVHSWVGYGATQYKETDTLAPGVTKCQAPHSGATTSFTYTVTYADGTEAEKVYSSTYRPLPRICLVGKAEETIPPEPIPVTDEVQPLE